MKTLSQALLAFSAATIIPVFSCAAALLSTQTLRVDSRTEMAAVDVVGPDALLVNGDIVVLEEAGRAGLFRFTTDNVSALVTDDPQQCLVVAPGSDTDGSSGGYVRVRESSAINVEMCGAIPGDGLMDTTAIQAAVNIAEEFGTTVGGTVALPGGILDTDNDLVIDAESVCIKGTGANEAIRGSTIRGAHTDGPVLRIKASHWCLENLTIHAANSRRVATILPGRIMLASARRSTTRTTAFGSKV